MAEDTRNKPTTQNETLDMARVKKSVDMLDDRLDNLDSIVSILVERMMKRFITIDLNCPHCGKNIQIGLIGSEKMKKQ